MPSTEMPLAAAGSDEILSVVVVLLLMLQLAPSVMLRLAKLAVAGAVDGVAVGSRRLG